MYDETTAAKEAAAKLAEAPDRRADAARELMEWIIAHDKGTREVTFEKALEYGSGDLEVMGETMLALMPQMRGHVNGVELACLFYAQGKIARIISGLADGRVPRVDSWLDLEVYAKMAQKVRETGSWL